MLDLKLGDIVKFESSIEFPSTKFEYKRGDLGIIVETDCANPRYIEVEKLNDSGKKSGVVFKVIKNRAKRELTKVGGVLGKTINDIIQKPVVNGIYRHFKGSLYVVQATAIDVTTNKEVVVYFSSTTGRYFTRPLSEFFSNVSDREDNYLKQDTRFMLYSGD